MTKDECIKFAKSQATDELTLYVRGGYGQRLTRKMKDHFINTYPFNRSIDVYGRDRKALIMAASENTRAYDCVCFVKNCFNNDKGNTGKPCPDVPVSTLLAQCKNAREINGKLPEPGDLVTFRDMSHCGLYVGDGEVAECTYKWLDKVQLTTFTFDRWAYCGTPPYYDDDIKPAPVAIIPAVQVMACKQKSNAKKYIRKGQTTFYVDKYYKNAYTFASLDDASEALAGIRETYPDAFITQYKASDLVKL